MNDARCVIGVDFGTESGRAVVVDVENGRELASAVSIYRNGVISERLPAPDEDVELGPEWALQDPDDYVRVLAEAIPAALRDAGIKPCQVIGVGIDFTSCTMLPTLEDGTPLCRVDEFRREPHAWVKLWKHHAAQPEADLINALAAARGEEWLARYGGKISSEWFIAKSLQILVEAGDVYARAERLIEAADWIVWQLTGVETRNNCTAGYKAIWSPETGFPSSEFFAALDPRFEHLVDEKLSRDIAYLGERAGVVSTEASKLTGLVAGTPVAVANVDAHVSVPAVGGTKPGTMVIIMGTSNCHILLGDHLVTVEGMCGVLKDGALPGLYGYEAGQSGVGDIFAWFVDRLLGGEHEELGTEAATLYPGESGLLALDWWNGNRSILVDTELSGVIVGLTLATRPSEIYRALLESTAFGTRTIIDSFEEAGVPVKQIIACGGLPQRNDLLMQIYADVTGREISIAASTQAPAFGSALFGAVAAGAANGGYDSIVEASSRMSAPELRRFQPSPDHHAIYTELYTEYLRLHDLFGRDEESVVKRLWQISHERASASTSPREVSARS
jgi:L-ribulokinase